ncbi:MAG TPA: c-type cytochrome [Pyrinomonadaceae bacterium]|nr:c-type cytochrome [Pyrinomonadaceae bacterium]
MKNVLRVRKLFLLATALVFPVAWLASGTLNATNSTGRNQNSAAPSQAAPTPQTEKPFDQAQALAELRKSIAGKENEPAEKVFKNIQLLKGLPAGRLLRIMEMGYSRSLGVTCTHCHVPGEWEKDEKPTKQIARDMAAMVAAINNQHLKQIKNLKSESPVVNCTTCHRGQIKPALNLPEVPKT